MLALRGLDYNDTQATQHACTLSNSEAKAVMSFFNICSLSPLRDSTMALRLVALTIMLKSWSNEQK